MRNRLPLDYEEITPLWIEVIGIFVISLVVNALVVLAILWSSGALAGGDEFIPNSKNIDCYALPQADLKNWKRVDAVDRHRISGMVARKQAVIRHEASLLCQNTDGGTVSEEYLVYEYWYRVIVK